MKPKRHYKSRIGGKYATFLFLMAQFIITNMSFVKVLNDEYGQINTYIETTPTAPIFGFAPNQPITPEMASIGSKIISEMFNNNNDEED